MAGDYRLIVRAIKETAEDLATDSGGDALEILKEVRKAIFSNEIQQGKVLISSSEAGGQITFALPQGHTPKDTLDLIQQAIDSLNGKNNIQRLRVSFAKASI